MSGQALLQVAQTCSRIIPAVSNARPIITPLLWRREAWSRQSQAGPSRFSSSNNIGIGQQYDLELLQDIAPDETEEEIEFIDQSIDAEGYDISARAKRNSNSEDSSTPRERPQLPGSIKKLNRLLGRQKLGDIPEHELKESFVRGSGPGGQAINKTSSSVSLIHLPTGVRVQAQPTRSREANRKAARRILAEKLDLMIATGSWSRDEKGKLREVLPGTELESGTKEGDTADAGEPAAVGRIPDNSEEKKPSRKESRKKEEVVLAESYSRQEILWEKERRRKANRNKKSKKKKKAGESEEIEDSEGGCGVITRTNT